ncbi:hypothetical protein [Ornithinimicrobium cerasi]|uniref:hypothetical protein n=1 Tax=Ornithinimicrobium cerasi TaxID=2248773 RepID=UPI000F007C97|nr:hypothetical protein [Ornithinimicrobium cerasi]
MTDTDRVLETLERELAFVGERRPDPGVEDRACRRAGEVLHDLWRRGELVGATPQEAYRVRCDGRTGTEADRAAGRLVMEVALAVGEPGVLEERTLVLETTASRPPTVLPRQRGLAEATSLARPRLAFVRRANLAPLVSRRAEETERSLGELFEQAAAANAVLLLEEAHVLLTGPTQHRLRMDRVLERLSARTHVPYVLTS